MRTENTTTDPTPETAKDRQLIYWQQQNAAQEEKIRRLEAEIDQLRMFAKHGTTIQRIVKDD